MKMNSENWFEVTQEFFKKVDERADLAQQRAEQAEAKTLKADDRIAQIEKSIAILEKQTKRTDKLLGDLGNRFGYYTEGLALWSVKGILEKEFKITELAQNSVRKKSPTQMIEIDILGTVNTDINRAVVVEVKTQLSDDAIEQVLETLKKFPDYYPEHKNKTLYGMMCCVAIPRPSLQLKLKQLGIYLAIVKGDIFDLETPIDFVPKNYQVQPQ
jgi:predicted nuclease with TOPRIM domain